jgi:hypothetical protein
MCLVSTLVQGQAQKTAVFGFQIEPIVPSDMFRIRTTTIEKDDVSFSINPKYGFVFGTYLAVNITERFTIESGISNINRDFTINAKESSESHLLRFTVKNFEIPLALTYYVRLSERVYMGHTLGISFQIPPSHLISRKKWVGTQGTNSIFEQLSIRRYWVIPTYKGGIGFEYRTESNGIFYIGPVYHLFVPLYSTQITYRNNDINELFHTKPIGDFFGIVFRYSFTPSPFLHKGKPKS